VTIERLDRAGGSANDTALVYAYALADLPALVRWLLADDRLEQVEGDHGAVAAKGLVTSTLCSTVLDERLTDAGTNIAELSGCIQWLKSMTTIGGPNDPMRDGSADAWLSLIQRLLRIDGDLAALAARDWFRTLGDAAISDAADDLFVERLDYSLPAYIAGVIDAVLGNDIRAERWLEMGEVESEAGGDGVDSFLAACRFVNDVMRGEGGA
jgi:hypothetical protein